MGFIIVMDGTKDFHNLLKVEYATDLTSPADCAESEYSLQILLLERLEGKSFTSVFLYPGIRPRSRMALVAAKFTKNLTTVSTEEKDRALCGRCFTFPCKRGARP